MHTLCFNKITLSWGQVLLLLFWGMKKREGIELRLCAATHSAWPGEVCALHHTLSHLAAEQANTHILQVLWGDLQKQGTFPWALKYCLCEKSRVLQVYSSFPNIKIFSYIFSIHFAHQKISCWRSHAHHWTLNMQIWGFLSCVHTFFSNLCHTYGLRICCMSDRMCPTISLPYHLSADCGLQWVDQLSSDSNQVMVVSLHLVELPYVAGDAAIWFSQLEL